MVAIIAVGPIVMFSHEPKIIYINDAINAAYSPYYKSIIHYREIKYNYLKKISLKLILNCICQLLI